MTSLYWALTTMTTVGYGDMFPETSAGRFIAAPLIAVGVGVCGYVAGFMSRLMNTDEESTQETHTLEKLTEISRQLNTLNESMQTLLEMKKKVELLEQQNNSEAKAKVSPATQAQLEQNDAEMLPEDLPKTVP